MAEVGFWLHGARGKLAGTSLRRGADGKTVMSEIVTPFNPRTNSQLFQRAIMATIMRAYSAGKEVFDHSFQGKSVGAASMATFMKRNLNILRALCSEEIDNIPWIHWGGALVSPRCRARLVLYQTLSPVGFDGMLISSGSYQQTFFGVQESWAEDFGDYEYLKFDSPGPNTNETCADYSKRTGLVADDLYTICGFYPQRAMLDEGFDDGASFCGYQRVMDFFIIRMHVKPGFVTSSERAAGKQLKDVFEFEAPVGKYIINETLMECYLGDSFWMGDFYENYSIESTDNAWCNIIRSRVNEDLRSTTVLKQNCCWANIGLIPAYVLPAWYPYIKGEPYPNPPIPPRPAAPVLTAKQYRIGTMDVYIMCVQTSDGSILPCYFDNGQKVLVINHAMNDGIRISGTSCSDIVLPYMEHALTEPGVNMELSTTQCSLAEGTITTKLFLNGGMYSFISDTISFEATTQHYEYFPISIFHV